jgi:hypothetical protein
MDDRKNSGSDSPNSDKRAAEIAQLHKTLMCKLRASVVQAIRIGELLAEQKKLLNHGEFTPWIEANLPFSDRTARNYIRLYKERARLKSENVSDLTTAYRVIRQLSWSENKPAESEEAKKTYITFRLDEDRKEIVRSALDIAKRVLNTEFNSQALEHICYSWIQSSSEEPSLAPMAAAIRLFEETYGVEITINNDISSNNSNDNNIEEKSI